MSGLCGIATALACTTSSADHFENCQALLQSSWQVSPQHQIFRKHQDSCFSVCEHMGASSCFAENCQFQNPKVWGPATWFFLHSVALSQEEHIPEDHQKRLARFFSEDLPWLLPCPVSGENFRRHLRNKSHELSTALRQGRQGLMHWVVSMHNIVNLHLRKPEVSFDDAFKRFARIYDSNHAPCFGEGESWRLPSTIRDLLNNVKVCVDPGCFRISAVWGPPTWFFLHSMTLGLQKKIPSQQQGHIERFLAKDLSWILPCPSCGKNLRRRLPLMPSLPDVLRQGCDALIHWLVALHNSVNRDLNKTEVPFTKAITLYADIFSVGVAPCMRQSTLSSA